MARTFKEATDTLGLSAPELGRVLGGVKAQNIRQARLDPEKDGYRPPPEGWEGKLARVARQRGGDLLQLADDLEGAADE